jgi:hypothetical protein
MMIMIGAQWLAGCGKVPGWVEGTKDPESTYIITEFDAP